MGARGLVQRSAAVLTCIRWCLPVWSAAVLTCIRWCLYSLLQSLPVSDGVCMVCLYCLLQSLPVPGGVCMGCCSSYLYQVVSVWSAAVITCIRSCLYGLLQSLPVSGGVCLWPQCRTEVCCSPDPRSGTGGIRTWVHQICSSSARTRGPTVSHT